MTSELIVNNQENRISIALLEDGALVELHEESLNNSCALGNIYLGRVKRIATGLNAAFIDIGLDKEGFLHYLDLGEHFQCFSNLINHLRKNNNLSEVDYQSIITSSNTTLPKNGHIKNFLKVGDFVLVQVSKEVISTKGPRLTCEIGIAGRNMILLPFYSKISLSQRIQNKEEKKRLKLLFTSILPKHFGVIVRTVCEQKNVAQLNAELTELIHRFEISINSVGKLHQPTLLLNEVNKITSVLRDLLTGDFERIHVNKEDLYHEIKQYVTTIAPEKSNIVNYYSGRQNIFEYFNLNRQIKSSFGRIVALKKGAYLIIEHTEALHVIDVNSGIRLAKSNDNQEELSFEVNLQAAEEIARQLRLRDMGGIIVIDFIDLHSSNHRKLIYEKMVEFMERDKAKHNILPLSKVGLMQLTRQRVRPAKVISTTETCPSCNGSGKISPSILIEDQIEQTLSYISQELQQKELQLSLHPFLAAYYEKGFLFFNKRRKLSKKYGCSLKIVADNSLPLLDYLFYDQTGQQIKITATIENNE